MDVRDFFCDSSIEDRVVRRGSVVESQLKLELSPANRYIPIRFGPSAAYNPGVTNLRDADYTPLRKPITQT